MRIRTLAVIAALALSAVSTSAHAVQVSWYGPGFHGKPMAGGGRFNMYNPSILAHKTLPFGTRVLLINQDNGNRLCGVVRDRGPYVRGRSYDLSKAGAKQLGILGSGVGKHVTEKIHGC